MNPYESPNTQGLTSAVPRRRLDPGVVLIGIVIFGAFIASIIGQFVPTVNDYLTPRFGSIGLLLSVNSLFFIGMWVKEPTRQALVSASSMTCAIGLINACVLLVVGTVDVVQNAFIDRLHSAWLWSVAPYLIAGAYIALAALRHQNTDSGEPAVEP